MPAVTQLRWHSTNGDLRVGISSRRRDLRGFDALTMRMAPDPAMSGPVDLSVRVVDTKGHAATIPVSSVSDALEPLPGDGFGIPKTILRTVRIPLDALDDVALRAVSRVELLTDRVPDGSVFVSDLAVARASFGAASSSLPSLPRLSVRDVRIDEGDSGRQVMRFRVTLSKPSSRTIRVHADAATGAFYGVRNVSEGSTFLVFRPGQTSRSLALSEHGNTSYGSSVVFPVVLAVPNDAILDRSVATGTITEDDPAPQLRISNATAVEHDGVLRFPMQLSRTTDSGVVVTGDLIAGSAHLGTDIVDVGFVAGFIDPGSSRGSIDIPIVDDQVAEPTETFTVVVSDVSGARLTGPATLTGTILDDD